MKNKSKIGKERKKIERELHAELHRQNEQWEETRRL
jgi:hypothetical protein